MGHQPAEATIWLIAGRYLRRLFSRPPSASLYQSQGETRIVGIAFSNYLKMSPRAKRGV